MRIYEGMNVQDKVFYSDPLPKNSTIHFQFIELLLSDNAFLSQLNYKEKHELHDIAISKNVGK